MLCLGNKIPSRLMKPLIGITFDYRQRRYRLKSDYIESVLRAGGLPLAICPVEIGRIENKNLPVKSQNLAAGYYVESLSNLLDGLLLSGGNDVSLSYYNEKIFVARKCLKIVPKLRVDFELSLLNEMLKRGKPVLGICFGMQLLNVAFKGSLYQDLSSQKPSSLNHMASMHSISILPMAELEINSSSYIVNSSHHQAVKKLGEGLEVFAVSDDNLIEGFYKKDYPFLVGTQWHPERMPDNELSVKILGLFIKKAQQAMSIKVPNNAKGGSYA